MKILNFEFTTEKVGVAVGVVGVVIALLAYFNDLKNNDKPTPPIQVALVNPDTFLGPRPALPSGTPAANQAPDVSSGGPAAPASVPSDRIEASATSVKVPPAAALAEAAKPQSSGSSFNQLRPVALAPAPAQLGKQTHAAATEPPPPSDGAVTARIRTAIEGETFALCNEPDFVMRLWSSNPNSPTEAWLRREGLTSSSGPSLKLQRGKPKAFGDDCEVTFVEVRRGGMKPVAVFEERQK